MTQITWIHKHCWVALSELAKALTEFDEGGWEVVAVTEVYGNGGLLIIAKRSQA